MNGNERTISAHIRGMNDEHQGDIAYQNTKNDILNEFGDRICTNVTSDEVASWLNITYRKNERPMAAEAARYYFPSFLAVRVLNNRDGKAKVSYFDNHNFSWKTEQYRR